MKKIRFFVVLITLITGIFLVTWDFKVTDEKVDRQIVQDPPGNVLNESTASAAEAQAWVVKAIDGDTIEVIIDGINRKVRYIGINTPETVDPRRKLQCFGKEASNENKKLVEGKNIILQKDVSETDKFGRWLRYVYVKLNDGSLLFVNDYLVREGFAQSESFPPDITYQERFKEAEREARLAKKGLWAKCPTN